MKTKSMIIILSIILPGGVLIALLWHYFKRNNGGIGESGYYDDEGNITENMPQLQLTEATYQQQMVALKYFKISEFDSPDQPGSGVNMRISTLLMIDSAREYSGVPYHVNSGYRTLKHNSSLNEVGSVKDSAHTKGYAVDVDFQYNDLETAKKIARGMVKAGFKRFGIYNTPTASFIHGDNDPRKKGPVVWTGKGQKLPFDPFKI